MYIYTISKKMYIYIYNIYTPRIQMVPQIFVALATIKNGSSQPPQIRSTIGFKRYYIVVIYFFEQQTGD